MTAIELVNYHAQIISELPELLSKLVLEGKKNEAMSLLVEWGNHSRPNSVIWSEAKEILKGA